MPKMDWLSRVPKVEWREEHISMLGIKEFHLKVFAPNRQKPVKEKKREWNKGKRKEMG